MMCVLTTEVKEQIDQERIDQSISTDETTPEIRISHENIGAGIA
jgi:hypothetical protein